MTGITIFALFLPFLKAKTAAQFMLAVQSVESDRRIVAGLSGQPGLPVSRQGGVCFPQRRCFFE